MFTRLLHESTIYSGAYRTYLTTLVGSNEYTPQYLIRLYDYFPIRCTINAYLDYANNKIVMQILKPGNIELVSGAFDNFNGAGIGLSRGKILLIKA